MKILVLILFSQLILVNAHAFEEAPFTLHNDDYTVRISDAVTNGLLPYYPGKPKRYVQFGEMLKQRTGADFIELSSMVRGQQDFNDASFGPSFWFVMGFGHGGSARYTTGWCDVAPKRTVSDDQCQFWDGQGRRIPSELVHFFQND